MTENNLNNKKKKKVKTGPYKSDEFRDYKYWKSLPALWKKMSNDELANKFGIDDDYTLELLDLKTQDQFANKYGLERATLTLWNKRIEKEGNEYLENTKKWARKLNKNVVMAHYNKLIRKFDPVSGDLWYKVVDGWNEKKEVEHSGKISLLDLADSIEDDD